MNNDTEKFHILTATMIIVLLLAGLGFMIFGIVQAISDTNFDTCAEKFGEGWEYRSNTHGPDMCVNQEGEAKYL
jgi:hypothetical protein